MSDFRLIYINECAGAAIVWLPSGRDIMPGRLRNIDLLRRSPFFAAAGEAAMVRLLRPSFTQQLPRGTVLFDQHELPNFLHLLLAGSVGLQARDEAGAATIVEIFGPGELFLAPAAILGLPYLVSGVALTDVRVLMIPAETCPARGSRRTRARPRHGGTVGAALADDGRPGGGPEAALLQRRVARFLARRVPEEAGAGPAELPEPRGAIAARLGMTPETLSRTLKALEARGLIRLSAKRADVIDRALLAQVGAR